MDNKIPPKIKRKIVSNNIGMIIIGVIICIASMIAKFKLVDMIATEDNAKLFDMAFLICAGLSAIFLVIIPIIALATGYEFIKVKRCIADSGISGKQIAFDYDNSKPVGKIRAGELCIYYRTMYSFHIVPIAQIGLVYKQEKISKQKKISRYRDGTIKNENYVISYKHTYNVVIKTLRGKTVTINCKTSKAADDIVRDFSRYTHIVFGEGKEALKAYREQAKAYRKSLKS